MRRRKMPRIEELLDSESSFNKAKREDKRVARYATEQPLPQTVTSQEGDEEVWKFIPQYYEDLLASGSSSKKTKRKGSRTRDDVEISASPSQQHPTPGTDTSEAGGNGEESDTSTSYIKKKRMNRDECIDLNGAIATESIPYLKNITEEQVKQFCDNLSKRDPMGTRFKRAEIIAPDVRLMLQILRRSDYEEPEDAWLDPNQVSTRELVQWLKQIFEEEESSDTSDPLQTLIDNILGSKVKVDLHSPKIFLEEYVRLLELYELIPKDKLTEDTKQAIVLTLKKNIKLSAGATLRKDATEKFIADIGHGQSAPNDFGSFCRKVLELNRAYSLAVRKVKRMENVYDSIKESEKLNKAKASQNTSFSSSNGEYILTGAKNACWICGNAHRSDCNRKNCSWANHENKPWKDSKQGKKYAALGWNSCPYSENPDGPPKKKSKGKAKKR